jgi:hypothetical protein
MGYQPRTDIAKDEKGDLFTVSNSIMAMWRNYFSQLLNVRVDIDVRQMEIHTAEPLVPEPSALEFEMVIGKLKRHKPGTDQIPAELIKAGDRAVRSEVVQFINSIWNKEELPENLKESIIVPVYKKGNKTYCKIYRGISLLPTTYKILSNILPSRLSPYAETVIGYHQYSALVQYLREMGMQ